VPAMTSDGVVFQFLTWPESIPRHSHHLLLHACCITTSMRHDLNVAVSSCHTCGLLQRVGVKGRITALRACHMWGL